MILLRRPGRGGVLSAIHALVRRWPLASFFLLAYVLSWAWWVPLASAGDLVRPGNAWPTHFPGLLGPALSAFVVTALTQGGAGVRDLVQRMGRWRVALRWYGWVLAPLVLFAVASATAGLSEGEWPSVADFGVISGLPAVGVIGVTAMILVVNAYGEETGWRGYALPTLQRRHAPLTASLLLAVGWPAGMRRCSSCWPAIGTSARSPCPASSSGWSPGRSS